jgi:hypothetical protein
MKTKLLSLFAGIVFVSACGVHGGGASGDRLDNAPDSVRQAPVKASELPDGITLSDPSLKIDLLQILAQRGGKDPEDRWIVDQFKGDIRIKKSRTDDKVYPPGASVEFWREERNGAWQRLPTA